MTMRFMTLFENGDDVPEANDYVLRLLGRKPDDEESTRRGQQIYVEMVWEDVTDEEMAALRAKLEEESVPTGMGCKYNHDYNDAVVATMVAKHVPLFFD